MAKKELKIIWRIKAIELLSFKVEEKSKEDSEYDPDKINFKLGVDVNVNQSDKLITVLFPVSIFSDETHSELLGSIHTKGEFIIQNLEDIMREHGDKLPLTILAALVGVVLSTTRGMLILLSKGTPFEKAMIPIINPHVFFQRPEGKIQSSKEAPRPKLPTEEELRKMDEGFE